MKKKGKAGMNSELKGYFLDKNVSRGTFHSIYNDQNLLQYPMKVHHVIERQLSLPVVLHH